MQYGTLVGQNVLPITDPYYDMILRGQMPEGLIVKKLFAQMPSKTYKGRIPHQNTPLQIRTDFAIAPSGFPEIKLDFEAKDTYKIIPRGLTVVLDYADIEELGGNASAQAKALAIINAVVELTREYQTAKNATDITVQTQYFNPAVQWSDPNADIQSDIATIFQAVVTGVGTGTGCGEVPNCAVIPWNVFNVLSRHPQLIKAYYFGISNQPELTKTDRGSQGFALSEAQMASLFGMTVANTFVPRGIYNSAGPGLTKSLSYAWGKNLIIAKIDRSPNPNLAAQSWGYTFNPSGVDVFGAPMVPAEFSYTWETAGVPSNFGFKVTKGYSADDVIVDANSACLVPSVIA
jgi:hypothetical protein